DGCGAAPAFVRAGEGPVVAPDGNAAQGAFGGVVREAEAAIVEKAGERVPALQRIVDRPGDLALARETGALRAQPRLERGHERPGALGADCEAPLGSDAVDLALEREQCVDALHRLDRDRRLLDRGELVELAPRMRPARRLDDRAR